VAETNGLLNRRRDTSLPRVRIPPSPPSNQPIVKSCFCFARQSGQAPLHGWVRTAREAFSPAGSLQNVAFICRRFLRYGTGSCWPINPSGPTVLYSITQTWMICTSPRQSARLPSGKPHHCWPPSRQSASPSVRKGERHGKVQSVCHIESKAHRRWQPSEASSPNSGVSRRSG
jgi:hypothetical protein